MDLTLFELHVDDVSLDVPLSGADGSDERSQTAESDAAEHEQGPGLALAAVAGLFVLLGVAVLLRGRRESDDDASVESKQVSIDQV